MLAGTSIGSGEWLFGPAVSAVWRHAAVAGLAEHHLQVFCNLMRCALYTIYCGEPIIVGGLRTRPGPAFGSSCTRFWISPRSGRTTPRTPPCRWRPRSWAICRAKARLQIAGHVLTEAQLVRVLGFTIFILCFVPLIFGGTVYRMLEKIMSLKLVLVLGYLTFLAVFMVSPRVGWEVVTGFFRFGDYPAAGRHDSRRPPLRAHGRRDRTTPT